jgi:HPt (histidine-containing phosphotransfer) domain-containing protein
MPEVLDQGALDALLAMVGDDPQFVDELVDTYLADAPRQMDGMRAALDAGKDADLLRHAHTLKGASLSLGGLRVAELARAIEELARSGNLDGVDGLLADLGAALRDLADALAGVRARRWSDR